MVFIDVAYTLYGNCVNCIRIVFFCSRPNCIGIGKRIGCVNDKRCVARVDRFKIAD